MLGSLCIHHAGCPCNSLGQAGETPNANADLCLGSELHDHPSALLLCFERCQHLPFTCRAAHASLLANRSLSSSLVDPSQKQEVLPRPMPFRSVSPAFQPGLAPAQQTLSNRVPGQELQELAPSMPSCAVSNIRIMCCEQYQDSFLLNLHRYACGVPTHGGQDRQEHCQPGLCQPLLNICSGRSCWPGGGETSSHGTCCSPWGCPSWGAGTSPWPSCGSITGACL